MTAAPKQDLYNPIDTIEYLFARDNVACDRRGENELVAEILGKWDNMLIFFAYEEHLRCLHLSCLLNMQSTSFDRSKMFELLALLNENLWLGHFSYWSEQKMPIFKHSLILQDNEELFTGKICKIIELAVMECERVYPIFNAVMQQNIDPNQAMYAGNIM
ncbi:MAG: YbjN domain-containing protein [Alphaproteobacteria bacterium]|nr:YbjN domain-containing protein [Alphaproteobacteria bacterium]